MIAQQFKASFAQNREDAIISGFFDDSYTGFYVDIGASHPEKYSVTKMFYDKGWHGINIEPIPSLYRLLEEARPRDINLNIGISNKPGKLNLREYSGADGLSTFSEEMKDIYISKRTGQEYTDYEVKVAKLSDILKKYKVERIDFMKVDVEGFEYEALAGNDWSKYRPKVLCIEANHILKDWRPMLKKYKYELVFFDGLNNYYVAAEHHNLAKQFSYERTILNIPPIPSEYYHEIEVLKHYSIDLQQKLEDKEANAARQAQQINQLEHELWLLKQVKPLIKALIKALDAAVLNRIQRLNKPKSSSTSTLLSLPDTTDIKKLHKALRIYDLNNNYTLHSGDRLLYKVVYRSYVFISGNTFKLMIKAARLLRVK